MTKTTNRYTVHGRGVNKRGNTMGIHYIVSAADVRDAHSEAVRLAEKDGYKFVVIAYVYREG